MKIITDPPKIFAVKNYFTGRFGLSEKHFDDLIFIEYWEKVYVLDASSKYPVLERKKFYGAGLLLMADFDLKIPANLAMTCFRKKDLKKNFIELSRKDVQSLYNNLPVPVSVVQGKFLEKGIVLVCLKDRVVCSAFFENSVLKINSGQDLQD